MATKHDIRSQALELSESDRGELARDLVLSLEEPAVAPIDSDRTWAPELRRRLDDALAGRAELISSDEAHASVLQAIRDIRRK